MSKEITPRQPDPRRAEFVRQFIESGNASEAAVAAGFVRTYGAVLLNDPRIAREIANEARQRLVRFAPRALNALEHLAENAKSEKVRVDCAKTLLDRVGLIPPKAKDDRNAVEIPLHEMSAEQLKALAAQLDDELAGRARPVNAPAAAAVAPGEPPKKRRKRAADPNIVATEAFKEIEGNSE